MTNSTAENVAWVLGAFRRESTREKVLNPSHSKKRSHVVEKGEEMLLCCPRSELQRLLYARERKEARQKIIEVKNQ